MHDPIIEKLQKFQGREELIDPQTMQIKASKERVPLWDLEGPRDRLFLYPRGHLKTTLITYAHTIQWIINYWDVRILLSFATGDMARRSMDEILGHFRYNANFRFLYPELCPPSEKVADFGSKEEFTVPCRQRKWTKEPTVSTCSVGKVIAGFHYEVVKHCDLVDKENIKTPGQIEDVKSHFGYTNPLLERGGTPARSGWRDVEGTRYDFSELYGTILDSQKKLPEAERTWSIVQRSAELDPVNKKSLWPERFPWEELMRIKADPTVGDYIYMAQYCQVVIPEGMGLATEDQIKFVKRDVIKKLLPYYTICTTVDLAGMNPTSTGDFEAMTVGGFDKDGRLDVIDIVHGHFDPHTMIELMFWVQDKYPQNQYFKIEAEAHARVLLPFLKREMEKRGKYLNIMEVKRDNQTSKQHRIRGLQPWFKSGIIRFCDDIQCIHQLTLEITRFPKFNHDDILDTLADLMQGRTTDGISSDVMPSPLPPANPAVWTINRFMGFDPFSKQDMWLDEPEGPNPYFHEVTGL